MLQIHEKIEQARISAGLSQEEMAEKLGIKRSTYQYWEQQTPSLAKIKKVAKVLNLSDDYFFGADEKNNTKSNQVAVVIAKEDLDDVKDILIRSAAKLVEVHYMLRILTGQEQGPEEAQEVSYKKPEKKTDKRGNHHGTGKKRTL